MLLIGAGLMIRSLLALRGTDPGFNAANLLTMEMQTPKSAETAKRSRFYDEFLPRAASLPGVQSVAAIDDLPMQGGSEQPIAPEGRPVEVFALQRNVSVRRTTPNYFRTMGIRILKGRDFTLSDTASDVAVAVVSQSMADLFWPGENPIGKRFRISFTPEIMREVVGVVSDIRQRGLDVLEPVTMLYLPILQSDNMSLALVVRGSKPDVTTLTPSIANVLRGIDSEIPLRNIRTMEELIAQTLSQARFSMWLFVALAGLAFLLASVGIYSVLAYGVRSRVREIGVRMALGARPVDVLRLVVTDGMRPTILGLAIGAFGAYALGGVLSTLIYGVSATDPLTFVSVAALLAAVALIACAIPAYRATRVRPVEALRTE
jgi:putative ABC transport system permease protein